MITIHQIVNQPVPSNCFVLYDKAVGSDCVVVDPGSKSDDELFAFLGKEGLMPQYIILTHEHFDHCWGVNELVGHFSIPIICSELCAEAIKSEKKNCSVFYDNKERFTINSKTISVESLKYVLHFAGSDIQFYTTPGHTEASISFVVGNNLVTGDTLIKDLRTITKLITGSKERLLNSMRLFESLKGNQLMVCPGHGELFKLDEYDLTSMIA